MGLSIRGITYQLYRFTVGSHSCATARCNSVAQECDPTVGKMIIVFLLCLWTFNAQAQEIAPLPASQETTAQEIFHSLMSPYCPGKLLSDCPSGAATELKTKIKSEVASGKDKETIINDLFSQFGEETLRAEPAKKGWGLVGWVVPGIFAIIGLIIVASWLRGSDESDSVSLNVPDISKELEARIRDELK